MAARLREIEHQIAELRAEADRIAHGYDPTAAAAELAASRDYARSVREHGVEETVRGCAAALAKYGFCVVEHCIPEEDVPRVRDEVVEATHGAPRDPDSCFALRLPQLCEYLGCPAVAGTARATLDEHIRIAQINTRAVAADDPDPNIEWNRGNEWSGGHSPRGTGWREWHTDWPHMVHGGRRGKDVPAQHHSGSIRKRFGEAFPDLPMCLSCVWYLTPVDATSGGTWVVPGSFKDTRNPFGPDDAIVRSAPIPGELQVTADAGSVFMQDTRTWHSSPMLNTSGHDRVAMVVRVVPWFVSPNEFSGAGLKPGSLSLEEWQSLPEGVHPLLRHLVADLPDQIQPEKQLVTGPYGENGALELERPDDANGHMREDAVVIPAMARM